MEIMNNFVEKWKPNTCYMNIYITSKFFQSDIVFSTHCNLFAFDTSLHFRPIVSVLCSQNDYLVISLIPVIRKTLYSPPVHLNISSRLPPFMSLTSLRLLNADSIDNKQVYEFGAENY